MMRLRLRAWLATTGALLVFAVPALAQEQAKDQAAPAKPAAIATPPATAAAPPSAAKPQTPAKPEPPPVAAAKPPPAKAATPPPRHIDTPKQEADSLLGKEVYGADGAQMGLVTNVLVDRAGHPIALVVDFGGFLGVGSRKVAVDWKLMHFHPGDSKKPVTLSLSKEQLKSAPEYKPDKAAPVVQAPKPVPAKPAAKPASAAQPAKAAPAATPAKPPSDNDRQQAKPAANPAPAPDHPAPK